LGISKNALDSEIRSSYINLAKKHHPDKGGLPEKFKEIHDAYTQLTKGENQEHDFDFSSDGFPGFEELFNQFTKMGLGFIRAPIVKTTLSLNLEQLESGGEFSVRYTRNVPTGKYTQYMKKTPFGIITGVSPEEIEKTFETNINIPRCHDIREPLVYPRLAKADNIIIADLEVTINLVKHPIFTKMNRSLDLQVELEITLKEALTGFEREIYLLNADNPTKIECCSIVNPYDTKVVSGYGMKYNDDVKGDLLIKFKIIFPILLSDKTIEKILEIDEL
jgi:DnaJ-class molecular chaperone